MVVTTSELIYGKNVNVKVFPPLWAPEALECFKQNLMGHSSGSLGNQPSEMRVVKMVLMGVLESIRTPTGNWAGGHLCCVLAKNPCILFMFRELE